MSLNGLDEEKVKEAYTAAVAEPGGWYALPLLLAPFVTFVCTAKQVPRVEKDSQRPYILGTRPL
jgi:hypothetical protein